MGEPKGKTKAPPPPKKNPNDVPKQSTPDKAIGMSSSPLSAHTPSSNSGCAAAQAPRTGRPARGSKTAGVGGMLAGGLMKGFGGLAGDWLSTGLLLGGAQNLAATQVVDLQGKAPFVPDSLLAGFIADAGPDGALIDVVWGTLASGKMLMWYDGCGCLQSVATYLDVHHPNLVPRNRSDRLVLVVQLQCGMPHGFLGVDNQVSSYGVTGAPHVLRDTALLPIIFGRSYADPGSLLVTEWQNEIVSGTFLFKLTFELAPPDGPEITGAMMMFNAGYGWKAGSTVEGLGIKPTHTDLDRTAHGILITSNLPPIEVSEEWKGKGFAGALKASYVDGVFLARGDLKFGFPTSGTKRVSGSLTAVLTTTERAWKLASSNNPAGEIAGSLEPSKDTKGMAVAAWGALSLEVTKNLNASATFVADPDGYVTAKGVLRVLDEFVLLDQKDLILATDNALWPWKHHWSRELGKAEIFLGVDGKLTAFVDLVPSIVAGPVKLLDITVTGMYSTRPETGSLLDIAGRLNASAGAQLTASAKIIGQVNVGLDEDFTIPIIDYDFNLSVKTISVEAGFYGSAMMRAYVDARPQITRYGASKPGEEAKYRVRGHVEAAGKFDLEMGFQGGLDLRFWKKSKKVGLFNYSIGGGFFSLDIDHTIGETFTPKFKFGDVRFDPRKFQSDLEEGKPSPKPRDPHPHKTFTDPTTGKVTPSPSALPPPTPQATPEFEIETEFEIEQQTHHLFLSLGPPPQLDVATARMQLSKRLETIAMPNVDRHRKRTTDPETLKLLNQQYIDLGNLGLAARKIEADAAKLGTDTRQLSLSEQPAVYELAEELAEYGQKYGDDELDGSTHILTAKIEGTLVKPAQAVVPGPGATHYRDWDEQMTWLTNNRYTYDDTTGIATKDSDSTRTARVVDKRWTLFKGPDRIASEFDIQPHGDKPTGTGFTLQSHHPVQDAWATARLGPHGYRTTKEPAIMLRDSHSGSPHRRITDRQAERLGTIASRNYVGERHEASIDFGEEGAEIPAEYGSDALTQVDAYFKGLHDNITDTATRKDIFGEYFK